MRVSETNGDPDAPLSANDGLVFISAIEAALLPFQPDDAFGLARRLDRYVDYIARRRDHDEASRQMFP